MFPHNFVWGRHIILAVDSCLHLENKGIWLDWDLVSSNLQLGALGEKSTYHLCVRSPKTFILIDNNESKGISVGMLSTGCDSRVSQMPVEPGFMFFFPFVSNPS